MDRLKCDQLLHGSERCSAANCYMGVRGTVRLTVTGKGEVQCDQQFHGSERYSATNCYMGATRRVRPTVTWE